MKKQYLLVAIVLFLSSANASYAQMVGTAVYLPGNFLEIGIAPNGSWGPAPAPGGYYPNGGAATGALAMVYDYGHDGWTVGAPGFYGDYVSPGTPFEGWSMQTNGTRSDAFFTTGGTGTYAGNLFSGSLTGANVSYTNTGTSFLSLWQGTCGGLTINQTTRVDNNASWAVVTTVFKNPTAAAIPGVYYWRTADPDNDEPQTGNFATNNYVYYQNDVDHRVMASSTGTSATDAYMALATKDCRAEAMIYTDWSPAPPAGGLDRVYNQTATGFLGTSYYGLGNSTMGLDIAIGLIYNLGTIAAGDSTIISYAYTFNDNTGIDSAFPEPALVINGTTVPPSGPAPAATYDTFNACGSGVTVLPVNLNNSSDKDWSWSTWSWSPALGLASTTGVTNTININTLPPVITYTITGTNSVFCNSRVMYLTVLTCNGATVNSPCLGYPLDFNAPGDSTGASYSWYGPAPSTTVVGTTQSFTITPSVWADTGTYHVVKTVGGVHDTASTIVVIHPKPIITASSNSPLCTSIVDTLLLTSTSSVAVTYVWSGPAGFAATIPNPSINGFTPPDAGTYTVIGTSSFGCKDTATTNVALLPPPGPPIITDPSPYCQGTTFVPFSESGVSGVVYWYPTANPVGGTTTAPTVNTDSIGSYTFYYNQAVGRCISPVDSITIVVNHSVAASFTYDIHRGCESDLVIFTNTTSSADSYSWNFGDGTPISTSAGPEVDHPYLRGTGTGAIYTVILTASTNTGCSGADTIQVDTKHDVIAAFSVSKDTFCAYNDEYFDVITNNSNSTVDISVGNTITSTPQSPAGLMTLAFAWNFNDGGAIDPSANPAPHPFPIPGVHPISLIVTDSIGCTATYSLNVVSVGVGITSFHDTTLCLRQPLPLNNVVTLYPVPSFSGDFTYSWSELPISNLDNPNIDVPSVIATTEGIYTDILTATINPWQCYAKDTITIHVVVGQQLTNVTPSMVIQYGSSVQLNSDNEVFYRWIPNDGTLDNPNINNPNATPLQSTQYTVYGMDQYGCVDSAFIYVTVDSTLHEAIPTAFTPNGDGLNDVFRPVGLSYQRLVEFRVFNRWGQQVFYSNDVKKGWDGTWNGVPQDLGVYNYVIIVAKPGNENHEGQNIVYKGNVTLIR